MPRRSNPIPTYRLHRATGQAVMTVKNPDGTRRDIYLGKYGTPESKAEYERLLTEIRTTPSVPITARTGGATVNECLVAFIRHAAVHYKGADGKPTRELGEYRALVRLLRELYGHTPAASFGPLALKAVRQRLVEAGLCRPLVNRRIGRVKRLFKWLASEELVPSTTYQALTTVSGLQKGRTPAPEPEPVRPASDADVVSTLPFLPAAVAGMVELQRLSGMRPGEVCRINPRDMDRSGNVWVYRPTRHKTDWRGLSRTVSIGPRGQAILERFTPADPSGYYFSPVKTMADARAARASARKTPRWPSHMARNAAKRKKNPLRVPAAHYDPMSYCKAVAEAIDKANAARDRHLADCGPNLPVVQKWKPNQLRHAHATQIRKQYGIEAAQISLGHSRADVTQVYAERDQGLAERVAAEVG